MIDPKLQLRVIGIFGLLAGISMLIQALILLRAVTSMASVQGPPDAAWIAQARSLVLEHCLIGFGLCVPLFLVVGIFVTFRIAGPLYRFKRYFEEMARDGYSGPCRIREDDELQDLCRLVNLGVQRLVATSGTASSAAGTPSEASPASARAPGAAISAKAPLPAVGVERSRHADPIRRV